MAGVDIDCCCLEPGRGHLAGDEAVPDEAIELEEVFFQHPLQAIGCALHICRPDRFVGFLCSLYLFRLGRLRRQIFASEVLAGEGACGLLCSGGNSGGVGTHVRDECHLTLFPKANAFVKALRQTHCPGNRETQAAVGFLLKSAGDKWLWRIALSRLNSDASDGEQLLPELLDRRCCFLLVS